MDAQADTRSTAPPGNGHRREEPFPETDPRNPAARAIHDVPVYIAELKAYARHFVSAKIDGYKASVRRMVMYAILGVVGAFTAAGVVLTAVFLLLSGVAAGLGGLLGGRYWLGNLIVGLFVLGAVWLGLWMTIRKLTRASRLKTEQKYERKHLEQRREFGRDVEQRAGESGRRNV